MLRSVTEMRRYDVQATDGPMGSVHDVFFDDERMAVRYVVVETGDWLSSRRVLISPLAVRSVEWAQGHVAVQLSQAQVRDSPPVDTHQPVSRQIEEEYLAYYGYPHYWAGPGLWGALDYPVPLTGIEGVATPPPDGVPPELVQKIEGAAHRDAHLRSAHELIGYHLHATDGGIGHVDDLLFDDRTWAVRYLVIDTSNWPGGRSVAIPSEWIARIAWAERRLYVDVLRIRVEESPEYRGPATLDSALEERLRAHHGKGDPGRPTA
jgi:uncharacterized protein YrrD